MRTTDKLLNAFNFSSAIANENRSNVKDVFSFLTSFKKEYDSEKEKLPYHINLIDELHANENAHSRILGKFLMQKTHDGNCEIIKRFIQLTKFDLHVKNPDITQEKKRIDLWIRDRDGGYAVIIENKICEASDEERQLARYIETTIDNGFKEEQIFVVYLSKTDEKKPDEQTWDGYKEKYKDRYVHLSYKDDILPWLKKLRIEDVLPDAEQKEVYLRSALEQYIDYLEGMFNIRTINREMNDKLQKFIKETWKIQENNPCEALEILDYNKTELEKTAEQIEQLKNQYIENCPSMWKKQFEEDFCGNEYKLVEQENGLGLKIKSADAEIYLGWWFDKKKQQQWCCELKCSGNRKYIPEPVITKVEHLLNGYSDSPSSYLCSYIDPKDTKECYPLLKKVVEKLIEI
jgi:hypothetical protein